MGPFFVISRNGTRIIAGSVLVGLALPSLAEALRPWLGSCVVAMFTVSLLRVDFAAFKTRMWRPLRPLSASIWMVVVLPLALLGLLSALGPPFDSPIVLAIVYLYAGPSAIVSAPAFAMLMGLDGALVLAVLLLSTVMMPLTAPWLAGAFAAEVLPVSAVDLALRLAGIIAMSFAAVAVLRRVLGEGRIAAARPVLDTLSVSIAVLFAIGAMDGVTERALVSPLLVAGGILGSFAFAFAQMALTYALFRPLAGVDAVAIGYAAGNRNAGLLMAALGVSAVSDSLWLFFALSQLPLFFFPLALKPLGRRLTQALDDSPGERR